MGVWRRGILRFFITVLPLAATNKYRQPHGLVRRGVSSINGERAEHDVMGARGGLGEVFPRVCVSPGGMEEEEKGVVVPALQGSRGNPGKGF